MMYNSAYLPERLRQCKPWKTILQYFTYNSNWRCERFALYQDGAINQHSRKCFDIPSSLKMASVKAVEPGNNSFGINHIIRCRSKLFSLGFLKFVLVLIL